MAKKEVRRRQKTQEELLQEELERRFQVGQAFLRLCKTQDWVETVDALLCDMQEEIDRDLSPANILSYPMEQVRDTVLLCHGKQHFINQFKERMETWVRDGQVNENQQSVILETKNDIGM